MNSTKLRSITWLGIGVAVAVGTQARAEEQSYYKGNSLEILLNKPDNTTERAFCAFRSTAWSGKSVAIEYTLVGTDKIVPRLRVTKQNWNLPVGQTTNVAIGTAWAGGIQFVSKVVGGDELYGEIPVTAAEDGGGFMVTTILGTAISTNKPAPLAVTFQGNEPVGHVPVISYADAIGLGTGFDNCITALTQLGPSLFASSEASTTSPFAEPPIQSSGTSRQQSSNRSVMFGDARPAPAVSPAVSASSWTFEKREEDWGDTCFLKAKQGEMTIGFMGAPGQDFVGFVENRKYKGVVRAAWQVDDKSSYMSNGHPNDYFGWYGFTELGTSILDDAKSGKQLNISDLDDYPITVSLANSATPISEFQQCFGNSPAKEEVASKYPVAPRTSPNRKGCVLEVDGKKAIDGACHWGPYGDNKDSFVMEGNRYFAIISISGSSASGSWNETPGSTHAHTDLGDLKRDGKCWRSKTVRVCPGH
ncbi:MAG: hypothetical protein AAGD15_01960 [Agrobacterium cavarae]|uniref:hypothetical protein n=1 Tax=Agrobacterium cavarae TaxID=2528239 RepID=UPI0031AD9D87